MTSRRPTPYGVVVDEQHRWWWFDGDDRRRRLGQLGLVAGVAAIELIGTHFAAQNQPESRSLDLLAVALLLAGPAALLLRWRFPVSVLLFGHTTTLVYWLLDYPGGPVFLAMIVAYFAVVLSGRRLVAWIILVAGFSSFALLPWLVGDEPRPSWAALLGAAAWMLVIGTVAEIARNRRERAIQIARSRQDQERRRVTEERLRIARELHDVLAHNISMINVQAGVALHLIDQRPDQAKPALTAIKQASKEALSELRSVLGVLRQVDEPGDGSRAPAPSLTRLDDLVQRSAATGLEVHKAVQGEVRPLPAPVDLAAFRIVQEALTNVVRHAGARTATVLVRYDRDAVSVQVDDDGRGAPSEDGSPGGSGLVGMRERAESVGGAVEAGPRPGGGFRVLARLPIEGRE
jgi:signal transduction histidine kinase